MRKLTEKEQWMLNYVKRNSNLQIKKYVSPTEVGREYGIAVLGKKSCHSSTASKVLLRLVQKGFLKRNSLGHYRYFEV